MESGSLSKALPSPRLRRSSAARCVLLMLSLCLRHHALSRFGTTACQSSARTRRARRASTATGAPLILEPSLSCRIDVLRRFMTSAGPCLPPPAPSHHYPSDGHENPITHPHPHPHKLTPSARLGTQPQGFESQVKVMPLPTESVNKEHTGFENAMLMRQQCWPHHKAHRRICRQQKRVQS